MATKQGSYSYRRFFPHLFIHCATHSSAAVFRPSVLTSVVLEESLSNFGLPEYIPQCLHGFTTTPKAWGAPDLRFKPFYRQLMPPSSNYLNISSIKNSHMSLTHSLVITFFCFYTSGKIVVLQQVSSFTRITHNSLCVITQSVFLTVLEWLNSQLLSLFLWDVGVASLNL